MSADPAPAAGASPTISVTLMHAAAPDQIDSVALTLPAGATARDALRASGLGDRLTADVLDGLSLGLWGRGCAPDTVLRDGDRLELLRPLQVDPKEARRQRYRRDGLRKRRRGG